MIEVLKPGLQTTVQDLGRPGHLALAMPPAGAMDQFAQQIANALVGNEPTAATLEAAMIGPTLTTRQDLLVAVTGADVDIYIDDEPRPGWTAIELRKGQVLRLGAMRRGTRPYVAVAGGLDVPTFLGSRATYLPAGVGGLAGRALRSGDLLPVAAPGARVSPGRELPESYRPTLVRELEARIVLGLCAYRFVPESLRAFTECDYVVSSESNRTGYRFVGDRLEFVDRPAPFGAGDNPSNVVSLGYPVGSIQVPNGEQPICLLRDAVTGGGFVTLGTVITPDQDRLAQVKAPDRVRFVVVDIEEALVERQANSRRLQAAVRAIG